ncbi:MAG TPA: phospho-sugar mutase, partial [Parachlamydiaceae bacterium]|nr:phospho-sugar mutase [Parachlamydiaceae bacterium]
LDAAYLNVIKTLLLNDIEDQKYGKDLHIIYTSLHGTGITLLPKALKNSGFTHISCVEEQCIPNGSFPTVKLPNPEEKAALELGIGLLEKEKADLLIANDPDADRVGVAILDQGKTVILNGNQIAALLIDFIFEALSDKMPQNAAFVKTIVTTELFRKIANTHGKECVDVLTGFKYIAEKIREWENTPNSPQYIFGGEESYGYLFGTLVRDKDAISTSVLLAEAALYAKLQGKTLIDQLHAIYKKYGCYVENVVSVKFEETKAGKEQMQKGMQKLRENPPKELGGIPVVALEDYSSSIKFDAVKNSKEAITLPKSDVLIFWLQDGSKLIVRPSGTEPKIKIYGSVVIEKFDNIESAFKLGEKQVNMLTNSLNTILK